MSGGLDSYMAGAMAVRAGFECFGLTVAYGQRHEQELAAAERVAASLGVVEHKVLELDLRSFGGSALTDDEIEVPKGRGDKGQGVKIQGVAEEIPVTYVPARNTIMLALALGWAEVLGAFDIFIGINAVDYSGYPDCRGEFIKAFEEMANLATAAAVQGKGRFVIHSPLLELSKAEIIRKGVEMGLDYSLTHSCYDPAADGKACGRCDSCRLRREGFAKAGLTDPIEYVGG